MTNAKNYCCHIAIIIICTIALAGCNSSTESKTGSLSGRITLLNDTGDPSLDPVDFSGVTVALYQLTVLDTTIVRLNANHPNIGIQISQETEFDHRLQKPVAVVETDASGAYSFKGINVGTYNLAVMSPQWAVHYAYNVSISEGNQSIGDIELKRMIDVSGYIMEPFVFLGDRSYTVSESVYFTQPVTIHTGSNIYVNSNTSVKFFSDLAVVQDQSNPYWKIDVLYSLYSPQKVTIGIDRYYTDITLYTNQSDFSHALVRHLGDGIGFMSGFGHITNVDIKNYKSGVSFNQARGEISNSSLRNGDQKGVHALSMTESLTIQKSIVQNTKEGILAYTGGGFTIEDCYFVGNETGIKPQVTSGNIRYNNFDRNRYDMFFANSTVNVFNNNFFYSTHTSITPTDYTKVYDNNFYRTARYFISVRKSFGSYTYVLRDLDAKNNYWAVSDIDRYLLDANDNDSYPGAACPHYVIYLPKRYSKVLTAGIRQ